LRFESQATKDHGNAVLRFWVLMRADVVVIGGGIAGLSTAYELARRGVTPIVLERAGRAGGVILSEEADGFTIDAGPDSLLVQKPDGVKLCEELGLGSQLVPTKPPRLAYIQRGGRLHALPAASVLGIPTRLGPFVRTRLFSLPGKIRMAREIFVPARRSDDDESIGAFMTRRFGKEATEYLAEPLLAGIHAGDVDRLSIGSLFPRFRDTERLHGSLLLAFRRQAQPGSADGAFRSLPAGLSQMIRALVAALPPGTVRTDASVGCVRAAHEPRTFFVGLPGGVSVGARALVFATPAFVTSALIAGMDVEIGRLCGEIPYASTATVVLGYRRADVAHPLHGSGFVVPRTENTGLLAGSWMSSKWPNRAPEGRVLLRAFVGGARDPHALDRPDDALVQQAIGALRPLLGLSGDPLLTRVYRWTKATAQHEVGHAARIAAIERRLGALPGVFVTGSGFRGVGIPDCVADGRATGAQVARYLQSLG
jgi:oxygen-dependent protoporphyrinogen oxidase